MTTSTASRPVARNDFFASETASHNLGLACAYRHGAEISREYRARRMASTVLRASMRFHARLAVEFARENAARRIAA